MFSISKLLQAAQARRRRPGGRKTTRRHAITMEQLDHRRLLSVNFSGNVATDFPATQQPGVVVFNSTNTPNIQHPIIPPNLQPFISTSGFDLSEIRLSYNPTNDTMYIGLNQPSANPANPNGPSVIAGDADNNGTAGTVNPAVSAAAPGFTEFYGLGGPETMAAFLDLTGTGIPGVVAGYSSQAPSPTPTNPAPVKPYQVAVAIPNISNPRGEPSFGTPLPDNTGNVYLVQTPAHPSLEFAISHFSRLYAAATGHALTPTSVIGVGAFAGSPDDIGISDAFFPENTFTLAQATEPAANPIPSPPVLINPHEHRIIDTAHRDLIRATVLGTSGFPVSRINPATVTLDGAHALAHIYRKLPHNEFLAETFVFRADQLHNPQPGLTTATLTGQTNSGTPFESQATVLNIPFSARLFGRIKQYMGGGSIYNALAKVEKRNPSTVISALAQTAPAVSANPAARGLAAIPVDYAPVVHSARAAEVKRPVVAVHRAAKPVQKDAVPTRIRYSMGAYVDHALRHPAKA